MARTLKTTGIATDLTFLVCYDDDNTTLKEWVSSSVNSNMTLTSGTTTGTTTWKSTTLGYWQPDSTHYLSFASGFRPTTNTTANSIAILMIDGPASVVGVNGLVGCTGGDNIVRNGNASDIMAMFGAGISISTTTEITTQRSYSLGFAIRSSAGNNFAWYGLESGSASAETTTAWSTGAPVATDVLTLGFIAGRGSYNAKYVLCAMFGRSLTTAEFQSIHDDPMGTLFEAAGGGNKASKRLLMGIG